MITSFSSNHFYNSCLRPIIYTIIFINLINYIINRNHIINDDYT